MYTVHLVNSIIIKYMKEILKTWTKQNTINNSRQVVKEQNRILDMKYTTKMKIHCLS